MNKRTLKTAANLQVGLGVLLACVSAAAILLCRTLVQNIPTDETTKAYLQTIRNSRDLATDSFGTIDTVMTEGVGTLQNFAAAADQGANVIAWWNTWLGKKLSDAADNAANACRHASTGANSLAQDLHDKLGPELKNLESSLIVSLESSERTCEGIRQSRHTVMLTIWIIGLGGLAVAAVVLINGLCLRAVAADRGVA